MKKYIACSEKPRAAKYAETAYDAIEKILDLKDTVDSEIHGHLSNHDFKILSDAYDILLDLERDVTVAKRGY